MIKILFLSDIVGRSGRKIVSESLKELKNAHKPDIIIANGENAAGGLGLDLKTADEIFKAGVDIITSGNHIWSKREICKYLDSNKNIIRPANYPNGAPGRGFLIFELPDSKKLAVTNFIGRVFIPDLVDCPFRKADEILEGLKNKVDFIFVDFHAEATSEKVAFAHYLDGRVSAVVGTHTHVQTADERILEQGTAYITDAGMCGASDGVIGSNKKLIIEKFITGRPTKFELAGGSPKINGVIIELNNPENGKVAMAKSIKRISLEGSILN
jgi:metallophosphoesterase (TIGR00282 family)